MSKDDVVRLAFERDKKIMRELTDALDHHICFDDDTKMKEFMRKYRKPYLQGDDFDPDDLAGWAQ